MPKGNHRIVIDTNLWISFLLTKNFSQLDSLLQNNELKLLFSQESLDELVDVVQRPKFKKHFIKKDIEILLSKISTKAEFVVVTSHIDLCRDKKDNFLLNLSNDGKATHLITGDQDLLVLEKYNRTEITTIAYFFDKL